MKWRKSHSYFTFLHDIAKNLRLFSLGLAYRSFPCDLGLKNRIDQKITEIESRFRIAQRAER